VDVSAGRPAPTVGEQGVQPAWQAFQSVRAKRRAVEWLVDNSLVDQQSAALALARYADADLP
jgi:hypothetical protein